MCKEMNFFRTVNVEFCASKNMGVIMIIIIYGKCACERKFDKLRRKLSNFTFTMTKFDKLSVALVALAAKAAAAAETNEEEVSCQKKSFRDFT
jgi:hypothetical protein